VIDKGRTEKGEGRKEKGSGREGTAVVPKGEF